MEPIWQLLNVQVFLPSINYYLATIIEKISKKESKISHAFKWLKNSYILKRLLCTGKDHTNIWLKYKVFTVR